MPYIGNNNTFIPPIYKNNDTKGTDSTTFSTGKKEHYMRKIVKLIFCVIITFISQQVTAQMYDLEKSITKEKLIEDLNLLSFNLEKVHSGLYTYTSKEEMNLFFNEIKKKLSKNMTSSEFYRLLAPLNQQIKNGHSFLIPSQEWDKLLSEEYPIFPFDIYYANKEVYILRNLSIIEGVEVGSKINTINGENAWEVFNNLSSYWTSDGDNRTFPMDKVMESFSSMYAHIYGIMDSFELNLTSPDGTKAKFNIKALKNNEINNLALKRYNYERISSYLRKYDYRLKLRFDRNIAILKVPTFNESSRGEDGGKYKKFYKRAFEEIKKRKISHLILDLRHNGGGDPGPQHSFLSNLINQPFTLYNEIYSVTKKLPNKEYYNDSFWFRLESRLAYKKDGEQYRIRKWATRLNGIPNKNMKPSDFLYTNNIYVLIDGRSFSATGEIAGMLKEYCKNVTFIGEETGGNPVENTSGRQIFLTLPNSKIRMCQSLITFKINVSFENNRHGIVPNYYMRNSIEDELDGKDSVLEWTISYIKKEQPGENTM